MVELLKIFKVTGASIMGAVAAVLLKLILGWQYSS